MELPPITQKQKQILLLLYRFRFLDRKQIQTLLNHKTFNRVNTWLKDLTEKDYIKRILDTESKINVNPAKYYLSKKAIRLLRELPECEPAYLTKLYREHKRTKAFIDQSLFIADIYLYLFNKYKSSKGFSFYTQSEYSLNGLIKEVFPLFVFRKHGKEPYFLAEIFREGTPKRAYIPKIEKYIQFASNSLWLNQEQQPKILLICPDSKLKKSIYRETRNLLADESDDLEIFITTKNQIETSSVEGEIWKRVEIE